MTVKDDIGTDHKRRLDLTKQRISEHRNQLIEQIKELKKQVLRFEDHILFLNLSIKIIPWLLSKKRAQEKTQLAQAKLAVTNPQLKDAQKKIAQLQTKIEQLNNQESLLLERELRLQAQSPRAKL